MSNELSTVQNPGSSEYVSHLLELMLQNLAGAGVSTKVTREPLPNKKTSLITEIILGLGISATWELIKFTAGILDSSRRASPGDEITLNGKRYTLAKIDEERPGETDNKTDQDPE